MAENSDQEKTEAPTARRIRQAREEGQVPQSKELSTFLVMITGGFGLWVSGQWMNEHLSGMMIRAMSFDRLRAFDDQQIIMAFGSTATDGLLSVIPLFGMLIIAAAASSLVMGGWVVSSKAFMPDFNRLNPYTGLKRMFSLHGLVELVKASLKAVLIGSIAIAVIMHYFDRVMGLINLPIDEGIAEFITVTVASTLLIISGLAILAFIDVPFQLWQYYHKLKMSKEEIRQESKQEDGDPQIKARIRQAQREMARNRMMAAVPNADVVVTNPTHFAVALKYDPATMHAPKVLAKGRGEIAAAIRRLATEHNVPMLEAPPLARALFTHVELEQIVPGRLFAAVAEVLAYVYQLDNWYKNGGDKPPPPAVEVPEDLDPGIEDDAPDNA